MTTALTRPTESSLPEVGYGELMGLAEQLVKTGFLPEAIKTPAQAVAIILTGREMGLGPMQSLRSIGIIKGKPVVAADLQLAIFHRHGGRSKWVSLTDSVAQLKLHHPNGVEHCELFTMEDARKAGLASSPMYAKYPKAMLRSRCITAALKSIGFEPCAGAYDPEELGSPVVFDDMNTDTGEIQQAPGVSDTEVAEDATITSETAITWGQKAGTKIKDLPTDWLKWATETGRVFGPRTPAWQEAFENELALREPPIALVEDKDA